PYEIRFLRCLGVDCFRASTPSDSRVTSFYYTYIYDKAASTTYCVPSACLQHPGNAG
ncbi:hypothetical protein FRB99_007697, partial [Tulasnella sp. 403]